MAYPTPTVEQLADFSGRASNTYTSFAESALLQSALLFTLLTGVTEVPDDADEARLIQYAIVQMADDIYLKQPFAELVVRPMRSETIGSYSYTIDSAAFKAMSGKPTGLMWWDLALRRIGQETVATSGSIQVFERDGNVWADAEGRAVLVGPAEVTNHGLLYTDLGGSTYLGEGSSI